jgi:hypothetical protein
MKPSQIQELRKTLIICGGLGASLYLVLVGRAGEAEMVCTATLTIWFFFL